mmetsp:Transcript_25366/g.87042  ORF Transcript_25366/g.87042 Transcript_25366/m.87042 type:complete len:221 (+) Transcript_25366:1-663(+)
MRRRKQRPGLQCTFLIEGLLALDLLGRGPGLAELEYSVAVAGGDFVALERGLQLCDVQGVDLVDELGVWLEPRGGGDADGFADGEGDLLLVRHRPAAAAPEDWDAHFELALQRLAERGKERDVDGEGLVLAKSVRRDEVVAVLDGELDESRAAVDDGELLAISRLQRFLFPTDDDAQRFVAAPHELVYRRAAGVDVARPEEVLSDERDLEEHGGGARVHS